MQMENENIIHSLSRLQRLSRGLMLPNASLLTSVNELDTSDLSSGPNSEPLTTKKLLELVGKWDEIEKKYDLKADSLDSSLNKSDLFGHYFANYMSEEARRGLSSGVGDGPDLRNSNRYVGKFKRKVRQIGARKCVVYTSKIDGCNPDGFNEECCELFDEVYNSGPAAAEEEVALLAAASSSSSSTFTWGTQLLKQELDAGRGSSKIFAGGYESVANCDDKGNSRTRAYRISSCTGISTGTSSRAINTAKGRISDASVGAQSDSVSLYNVSVYGHNSILSCPNPCDGRQCPGDMAAVRYALLAAATTALEAQRPSPKLASAPVFFKQQEIQAAGDHSCASVLRMLYCVHEPVGRGVDYPHQTIGGLAPGTAQVAHKHHDCLPAFVCVGGKYYSHAAERPVVAMPGPSAPAPLAPRSKRSKRSRQQAEVAPTSAPDIQATPALPDMSDVQTVRKRGEGERKVYSKAEMVCIKAYQRQLELRMAARGTTRRRRTVTAARSAFNGTVESVAVDGDAGCSLSLLERLEALVADHAPESILPPEVEKTTENIMISDLLVSSTVSSSSSSSSSSCENTMGIGRPHFYFHAVVYNEQRNILQCCVHFVYVSDVVLGRLCSHAQSGSALAAPVSTFLGMHNYRKCDICAQYMASKVTFGDRLCARNPTFFCDVCYHMLHYTKSPATADANLVTKSVDDCCELTDDFRLLYDDFAVYSYRHDMRG